jgi:MFS family permease
MAYHHMNTTPPKYMAYLVLLSTAAAFLVGNYDIGAFNLAVVWVQRDFHMSLAVSQWLSSIFLLTFACFLIPSGRLSDLYGPKRFFSLGLILFMVASIICIFVSQAWEVISMRAIQGVGMAFMWPPVFSISMQVFPEKRHGHVMGVLMAMAGIGQSIAPFISGAIIQYFSWRWVLIINVPFCIISMTFLFLFYHPESPAKTKVRFDWLGASLLIIGSFGVVYFISQLNNLGQAYLPGLLALGISLFAFISLPFVERRHPSPILKFETLKNRVFLSCCICRAGISFAFIGSLFIVGYYLQHVLHFSALNAGLYFLPLTAVFGCLSPFMGKLADRFNTKYLLLLGQVILVLGLILLSNLNPNKLNTPLLLLSLVILGLAFAIVYTTVNLIGISALNKTYRNFATGFLYYFSMLFAALSSVTVALISHAVGVHLLLPKIGAALPQVKKQALLHWFEGKINLTQVKHILSHNELSHYFHQIQVYFTDSLQYALLLCAALVVLCATLFYFWVIKPQRV